MEKVFLKLGGAILTYKDTGDFPLELEKIKKQADYFINQKEFYRILSEELLPTINSVDMPFLAVGVGPFGHRLVYAKALDKEIHKSVSIYALQLSKYSYLSNQRQLLPIVYREAHSPNKTCSYQTIGGERKLVMDDLIETIYLLNEEGKKLLVHGDVIPDYTDGNMKVLSMDEGVVELAIQMKADRIVMATGVDGFYDRPPIWGEKLIREIKADEEITAKVKPTYKDVTGSLPDKVRALQRAAKMGIPGKIVNGFKRGYIRKALLGEEVEGTAVLP